MACKLSKYRSEVADRAAIEDCIGLFARAADRGDPELLKSIFWEDALITGDLFSGNVDDYIERAIFGSRAYFDRMFHLIGNMAIKINGMRAAAESYFYSYQTAPVDAAYGDLVVAGRYLDRFEQRDDEWRFVEKTIVFDWYRDHPDTVDRKKGPMGAPLSLKSAHAPDDRSYALFKTIE